MEYVVPLVIVLVIIIAVVVVSRLVGRRSERDGAQGSQAQPDAGAQKSKRRGREVTREMAVEAGAKLDADAHRAVYSLIAQRQVLNAVKAYRKATGVGLGESAAAVAALAEFPQPFSGPKQPSSPAAEDEQTSSPVPAGKAPSVPIGDAPLTVEDIINAAPAASASTEPDGAPEPAPARPAGYRYRAIVSRGDEVREVASTRLNDEIFAHVRSLALSGDLDGAARVLREHADISADDALEFVSMIEPGS